MVQIELPKCQKKKKKKNIFLFPFGLSRKFEIKIIFRFWDFISSMFLFLIISFFKIKFLENSKIVLSCSDCRNLIDTYKSLSFFFNEESWRISTDETKCSSFYGLLYDECITKARSYKMIKDGKSSDEICESLYDTCHPNLILSILGLLGLFIVIGAFFFFKPKNNSNTNQFQTFNDI